MGVFKKMSGAVELDNGEVISDLRITVIDRVAFDRYSRASNVTMQNAPSTSELFLVWHAAKRVGVIDFTFDEAVAGRIVDINTSVETPDDVDDDEADIFPTVRPGA